MRVIVTGGAGFIGSYLAKALLAEGHFVQVIDNLSTGRLENVAMLANEPNFRLIVGDVQTNMGKLLPADVIFHFAATARIGKSIMMPYQTIDNNTTATTAVLEFVRTKSREATIIHATTSNLLFTDKPENPYALSKLNCERTLDLAQRIFGVSYCNVRFFNIFGDGEADCGEFTTVIEKFKMLVSAGHTLPVYGDGTQRRAFTYIDDAVSALLLIMNHADRKQGFTYNIGSDRSWSVQEIVDAFDHPYEYQPRRWFDVQETINECMNIPGWAATTSPIEHIKQWKNR